MAAIAFSPMIGPVPIGAVIREKHRSTLEVTHLPVEEGADITDHAVVMPKSVTLECADSAGAATYQALVAFQESRVPFTLVTGLMVYENMLPISIEPERTVEYSKVFNGNIELQEIIIVGTAHAASDETGQGGQPGGTDSTRSVSPSEKTAADATTADRASSSIQRGDVSTKTVPADQGASIAYRLFGS
jgi:hypothetical protein